MGDGVDVHKVLRILILSTEFPPGPGGIGHHAYQLASHLCQLKWQVMVASPQDYVTPAQRQAFNEQLPFPIITLTTKPIYIPRRLRRLYSLMRTFRPQVLLASGSRSLWLGGQLAHWSKIPWVAMGHGSEFLTPSWWRLAMTRHAIKMATAMVAVSQYTAQLMDQAHIQSKRLVVIPNGADQNRFRPGLDTNALRQRLKLTNKRVILTVGNMSERKAQDVVIRALPEILAQCADVVYVIVGLPTRQAALEALATTLGVRQHVCFVGPVPDHELAMFYNLCDLFVLVSRKSSDGDVEGYGIVVVEAAMCGKAAVVSCHGGLPEAVHYGETGLLVPEDEPGATAQAILQLLMDNTKRVMMGHKAWQKAQHASWVHRVSQYDDLLQTILSDATE